MKLYYDAAYGLLFICAGWCIGYFDAYCKNEEKPYIEILETNCGQFAVGPRYTDS